MDIKIFLIKMIIITIIFVIFGILGFVIGIFLDNKVFEKYDNIKYRNKKKILIWLDIIFELAIFGIILFVGRTLFSTYLLPSFEHIINNTDFEERRDIKSTFAFIFTLTLLYVQYNLRLKLDHLAGINGNSNNNEPAVINK